MKPTPQPEGLDAGEDISIIVESDGNLFLEQSPDSIHIGEPETAREVADELIRFADWREGKPEVTTTTQTNIRYPGFSVTFTVPHDADYDAKAALDASWALVRLLTSRTEAAAMPDLDAELEGLSSQPEDRG